MQATLTYNPRDVLEIRAAINHLEAVHAALRGDDKPAGDITLVNALGQEQQVIRGDDKPEAPKATRTRKPKDDPKPEPAPAAEEPPAEEPAAEQPVAQEPDLDNFGEDEPAAPAKEYAHDDLRDAVKKVMAKDASKRPAIGNILGKYTTDKQIPSVPAAKIAAVIAEVEALV